MSISDITMEKMVDSQHITTSVNSTEKEEGLSSSKGFLATLRRYEDLLDRKLGVESFGPRRLRPEDRDPKNGSWSSQIVMALMWTSTTLNIGTLTTGFLGWEMGLSLSQTIWITIVGTFFGSITTGWCATMGPPTGLRQVSISRYSMGWWPAKIIAALNVVEQIGWCSVSCITGGLALTAVCDDRVSLAVGVIIVAIAGLVFSFIGLRGVLAYEKYTWIPFSVIFFIMYGEVAPKAALASPALATGMTNTGAVLTLFAVVYGGSTSWCSIVSDFYVHYPINTSKWRIFLLTSCGIFVPSCFGMLLGCCMGSTMGINNEWADVYADRGVGWLILTILYPRGFAKFLLTVLFLSGIGANCISMYAASLSIQQFAQPLRAIPRFCWTFLVFAAVVIIGVVGRNKLLVVLQNFLSLLGYWNTSFFVIVFVEHYWFRNGWHGYENYDLEAWDDSSRMPVGVAGFVAFAAGVVGAVLGMAESWWTGPIARTIGDSGGDVGNELSLVFTLVAFVAVRYLELKYIGR